MVEGVTHRQVRRRVPPHAVGLPVPGQHRDHLQQHQRLHRQPAGAVSPSRWIRRVFKPQQYYLIGFVAGLVAGRPTSSRSNSACGMTSTRWSRKPTARRSRSSSRTTTSRPTRTTSTTPTRTTSRRAFRPRIEINEQDGDSQRDLASSTGRDSSRIASSRSRTSSSGGAWRSRHPEQRAGVPGDPRHLSQTSCRSAATRTTGRTSTTCSTA